MADFNWYLNKSGLRGLTGEKGDQGFSPIIDVIEDTIESYKLRITTEDNEIETPNLKGSVSIQDQGGTYVRYDRETGELTANEADRATKESYGVVRLSKIEDLDAEELQDTVAMSVDVTKNLVSDSIHAETVERINADASIRQSISTLSNSLQSTNTRVTNITNDLDDEKRYRSEQDRILQDNITTEAETRWQADNQLKDRIDAERQEREVQDASLQNQLGTKLTVDNIKAGDNVTITKDGNNVTINSTGGGGPVPENIMTLDTNQEVTGEKIFKGDTLQIGDNNSHKTLAYLDSTKHYVNPEHTTSFYDATVLDGDVITDNIYTKYLHIKPDFTPEILYSPVLNEHSVDNQTIKVVDGLLHADFSEIGDEVNTLAGRMNTVENELGDLTERVDDLSLFKFPNATIIGTPTINNGQISNFSAVNYLQFPFEFETKGRTWLLNGSFDTRSDVTIQQNIIDSLASVALAVRNGRLVLALSTNGTSFDLGEHLSMSDIEANTKYYYRLSFSGTQYLLSISTDKQEWLPEIIITSDQPIASKPMTISSSGHPFNGTINLNDWDLTVANTLVWQGMDDVGIASRVDVNATNFTETGKENIRDIAGVGQIEEALDLLNGADTTLLSTKADISFSNINDDAKQVIRDIAGSGSSIDNELSNESENAVQNKAIKNALDLKADKTEVDGQWVFLHAVVASNVTMESADTTYDISSVLPNDGYNYEISIGGSVTTSSTSGTRIFLLLGSDLSGSNSMGHMVGINNRTSSTISNWGSMILPVGSDRKVVVRGNTSPNGTYSLEIRAYRRLGLNIGA